MLCSPLLFPCWVLHGCPLKHLLQALPSNGACMPPVRYAQECDALYKLRNEGVVSFGGLFLKGGKGYILMVRWGPFVCGATNACMSNLFLGFSRTNDKGYIRNDGGSAWSSWRAAASTR